MAAACGNKERMTRWSKNDPVVTYHGKTDNWAKLRVKVENEPINEMPAYIKSKTCLTGADLAAANGDGRVSPRGHAILSQNPLHDLHGAMEGNITGMQTNKQRKSALKTELNDRAKGNFKYWYQERPKPTKFGAYGIGSGFTVLGLGSAPRT